MVRQRGLSSPLALASSFGRRGHAKSDRASGMAYFHRPVLHYAFPSTERLKFYVAVKHSFYIFSRSHVEQHDRSQNQHKIQRQRLKSQ